MHHCAPHRARSSTIFHYDTRRRRQQWIQDKNPDDPSCGTSTQPHRLTTPLRLPKIMGLHLQDRDKFHRHPPDVSDHLHQPPRQNNTIHVQSSTSQLPSPSHPLPQLVCRIHTGPLRLAATIPSQSTPKSSKSSSRPHLLHPLVGHQKVDTRLLRHLVAPIHPDPRRTSILHPPKIHTGLNNSINQPIHHIPQFYTTSRHFAPPSSTQMPPHRRGYNTRHIIDDDKWIQDHVSGPWWNKRTQKMFGRSTETSVTISIALAQKNTTFHAKSRAIFTRPGVY